MAIDKTRLTFGFLGSSKALLTIRILLVVAIIGILGFTVKTAKDRQLDNIIVDLAAKQDALTHQFLKEVLLRSHGASVDHQSTQASLHASLELLTNGGSVAANSQAEKTVNLPPTSKSSIRGQLIHQKDLLDQFTFRANQFLELPPSDATFGKVLEELLSLSHDIHNLSETIHSSFTTHAQKKFIGQSSVVAILGVSMGILGLILSAQLKRRNRELKRKIGERDRAKEDLRLSEERFSLAVQGTSDGLWDCREPMTVEPWNYSQAPDWYSPRFKQLLGYGEEEFANVRESWLSHLHTDDRPRVFSALRDHLEHQVPYDIDFRMRTREGVDRWFNGKGQALWNDQGKPTRMAGFIRDITERRQAEEDLRESEARRIEAFRQSDAVKTALLCSVSHELRTPLTSIKASVSSLLGQGVGRHAEVQEEFLQDINLEIDYLTRLVENLLDMSRIEAGTLMPHFEWHPIEDLVEGAIRRTTDLMQPDSLEVMLEDGLPPVFVDGLEIQQVLVNLLDNAAKYSPVSSPIRIEVTHSNQNIQVRVSDQGEGIPEGDLEKVFERFYRVQVPRDRSIRGTGLGLSICKSVVEAHGGQIWVEPMKGKGTTIVFTLPVQEFSELSSFEGHHQELVSS